MANPKKDRDLKIDESGNNSFGGNDDIGRHEHEDLQDERGMTSFSPKQEEGTEQRPGMSEEQLEDVDPEWRRAGGENPEH